MLICFCIYMSSELMRMGWLNMEDLEQLKRILSYEKEMVQSRITEINKELAELGNVQKTIIIKKISGKCYYYNQWMENKKLRCKSLGPVAPGVIADFEQKILKKNELEEELNIKKGVLSYLEETLTRITHEINSNRKIINNYTFEVYWKDEITARVYVKEHDVTVSRFTDHPLKQIFAQKKMTRYQLNRILELRCWERDRADINELLENIGLQEYNPQEIVRKTHGVSFNDYIWIRFPGEKLTSKDVLVR